MYAHGWVIEQLDGAAVRELSRALGVSPVLAAILVRRGFRDPARARAFLERSERHDPELLPGAREAVRVLERHLRSGSRIVVHGDYDVDGVCATALAVRALRALGADPRWFLPAREEGYGLSLRTVEQLAARGCELLLAVDCGVTAAAEIARARELGIEVVVVDHHRRGQQLPPATLVHPELGPTSYPTTSLCATATVAKLFELCARTLGSAASEVLAFAPELCALATVCDVVPLEGENRRLVAEGLRAFATTRCVGLRALCEVAGTPPSAVGERELAFRLGPRLNAAGRIDRPDCALELLLCDEAQQAAALAAELDALNRRRQEEELRTLFAAESQCAEQAARAALVVAGEGWHPGVVGIVASRLVERWRRPCVVVALDGDRGRGSGRSIPAYDLHAGLAACASHLERFGGHRLAAGLEIRRQQLPAFAEALAQHAGAELSPHDLRLRCRIDAVVSGHELDLELATELERLRPFGAGNPAPLLLLRAARAERIRPLGEGARHARLTLRAAGGRLEAVAFGVRPASLRALEACEHEVAVRLERNEHNGWLEARAVVAAVRAADRTPPPRSTGALQATDLAALGHDLLALPRPDRRAPGNVAGRRRLVDLRGLDSRWLIGELAWRDCALVVADADRRRERLLALGVSRESCGALLDWEDLCADRELAGPFARLVALDPPPLPEAIASDAALAELAAGLPGSAGELIACWGEPELRFALDAWRWRLDLRSHLRELWRELRAAGGTLAGEELRRALRGRYRHARPPALRRALAQTLAELGLAEVAWGQDGAVTQLKLRNPPEPTVELEKSPTFAQRLRLLEALERVVARAIAAAKPREAALSGRL